MTFKLIDSNWAQVMDNAARTLNGNLRIVCPFIKSCVVERLFWNVRSIQVITRFNLGDFYNGVSDIQALSRLLNNGAEIRGVRNLHSKLYIYGNNRAIISSANLTNAALNRNYEFGFESDDSGIITACNDYFENLWMVSGQNITIERLAEWEDKVSKAHSAGSKPNIPLGLGDEGVDIHIMQPSPQLLPCFAEATQWFVKFFGTADNRELRSTTILDELESSGSHWACTYSKGINNVNDGAVMFPARMVRDPDDTIIYGRTIGMRHRKPRDIASEADIELRSWKKKWPYYVRVHHGEFVAGTLDNGISLKQLMDELESEAFVSTKCNAESADGNTNPRFSIRRQPSVALTPAGAAWVEEHLNATIEKHGMLSSKDLDKLDWPEEPV